MKIGELSSSELTRKLSRDGIYLRTGPFVTHFRTSIRNLIQPFRFLYSDFTIEDNGSFADFHVRVKRPFGVRRWIRAQAVFVYNGSARFNPSPLRLALPLFEWGMNWCVATQANQYLILHSAAVERNGRTLILPAPPGSGKSTLCAALVHRGWRLLSDELTLVNPDTLRLMPLPRPVGLKERSIEIIRMFAPDAFIGPECTDTHKGTVAHMKPPGGSVTRAEETSAAAWIAFPTYRSNTLAQLQSIPKSRAFLRLAKNAFNYSLLGAEGFTTIAGLIDSCNCFEVTYGGLDEAMSILNSL